MIELTDKQLIEELQKRFDSNTRALNEQKRLLTELEKVNKKLVDSEKLKSQFLSNIRNEINNPLTSILGLSKQVGKYSDDKASLERVGKLIHDEAFKLDFQLRNIFVAAELESGELIPEISHIDVAQLIKQVYKEFDHQLLKKNIQTKVSCPESLFFYSDAEKIHIIITNLISNAIKYSHDDAHLNIQVDVEDDKLLIEVSDTGIGIEQDDQKVIYDRFRQLESGSTKTHEGHGLGLSIVKDLLEMIDGTVEMKSIVGEGTTFTIKIPEKQDHEEANITLGGNEFLFEDGGELF